MIVLVAGFSLLAFSGAINFYISYSLFRDNSVNIAKNDS